MRFKVILADECQHKWKHLWILDNPHNWTNLPATCQKYVVCVCWPSSILPGRQPNSFVLAYLSPKRNSPNSLISIQTKMAPKGYWSPESRLKDRAPRFYILENLLLSEASECSSDASSPAGIQTSRKDSKSRSNDSLVREATTCAFPP